MRSDKLNNVDMFIVTPDYWLKYNSGVTEMLKNYTQAGFRDPLHI